MDENKENTKDKYDNILNIIKKEFFNNLNNFTDEPIFIEDYIKKMDLGELDDNLLLQISEELELEIDNHNFFSPTLMDDSDRVAFFYLPEAYKNAQFCIKPTEDELNLGILVPGHKLTPFLEWDIPPAEANIYFKHNLLSTKKQNFLISDFIKYISYYPYGIVSYLDEEGTEFDPEFFKPEDSLAVSVFNFGEFYREHNFQYGDFLVFTVTNYIKGEFSVEYRPAEAGVADMGTMLRWIALMEDGIEESLQYYQYLLTSDEQLNFAFLKNKEFLLKNPVVHLDAFLELSTRIKVTSLSGSPIFVSKDSKLEIDGGLSYKFDDSSLQNMINEISDNDIEKLETLDDILMYLGHDLTSEELEAYMRDELFHKSKSFENVWNRCFDDKAMEFEEFAILEDNLRTQSKKLWNKISEMYDLKADEEFGGIREKVLLMKDQHLKWIRNMLQQTNDVDKLLNEDFVKLAELSSYLSAVIASLNGNNPNLPWKNKEEAFKHLDVFAEEFDTTRMKWEVK